MSLLARIREGVAVHGDWVHDKRAQPRARLKDDIRAIAVRVLLSAEGAPVRCSFRTFLPAMKRTMRLPREGYCLFASEGSCWAWRDTYSWLSYDLASFFGPLGLPTLGKPIFKDPGRHKAYEALAARLRQEGAKPFTSSLPLLPPHVAALMWDRENRNPLRNPEILFDALEDEGVDTSRMRGQTKNVSVLVSKELVRQSLGWE